MLNPKSKILVDLIHTHTQCFADHRLEWDNYDYDQIFSPARIFDHLTAHGYEYDLIREGELTYELLQKYDILFINLLNEEDPPISESEFAALARYLSPECGGSVFIIAEHTNCYRHAERLNPFLANYDIYIQYTSALDTAENCVDPYGWISISRFDTSHPTNEGIERISFQLGGTLGTSHGTAFLSPYAFGDYWNPDFPPSFVGDKRLTLDESKEPRGSLPTIAAVDNIGGEGGGKLIVVADQNIYGDPWIHYHDNFRHAMNVFEWLGDNFSKRTTPLRDIAPTGTNIAFDSYYSENTMGKAQNKDYYTFYVNMNRDKGVSSHVIYDPSFSKTRMDMMDVVFFPPITKEITDYEPILSLLKREKKITFVITFDIRTVTLGTMKLIAKLAPTFNLSVQGDPTIYDVKEENQATSISHWTTFPRYKMTASFVSDHMKVDHIQLIDYYFARITSSWGKPFLQTKGDPVYDLARVQDNIIIIFQDEMFRCAYLGSNEARLPNEAGICAVNLQYALVQFLKSQGSSA